VSRDTHPIPFLFLKPGELMVRDEPMIVTTLLGSCVAVTMFCPRLHLGAICHALLPACREETPCRQGHGRTGKYVECAIRIMLEKFQAHGVARSEIDAKLFGGSDMFDKGGARSKSVGRQNMEMALGMLEDNAIRVVTQDLGGARGRKIIFHTHTGEVFLKRLRKSEI